MSLLAGGINKKNNPVADEILKECITVHSAHEFLLLFRVGTYLHIKCQVYRSAQTEFFYFCISLLAFLVHIPDLKIEGV